MNNKETRRVSLADMCFTANRRDKPVISLGNHEEVVLGNKGTARQITLIQVKLWCLIKWIIIVV